MSRHLLVYVHIPFCRSKCHFCDWVQQIPTAELRLTSESPMRISYIQALTRQILHCGTRLADQDYRPAILYWGGGTASDLSVDEILAIMSALRRVFDLSDLPEATIECSPNTLTPEKLKVFRSAGFNRISIGVQSFDDRRLRKLGRAHSAEQAAGSLLLARSAGFEDINIDLICGLPGQTVEEFEHTLRTALNLPVNHFSVYPYRPSHGTVMRRQLEQGLVPEIDFENQLASYEMSREILAEHGYNEYAMCYFGAPRCQSDMAYFTLQMDWIGLGSGANSLVDGRFFMTHRGRLRKYIADPIEPDDSLPAASPQVTWFLLCQALATFEGVVARHWEERLGVPLRQVLQQDSVQSLLGFFSSTAGVIQDETGIRLPPERIAKAFIHLQCMSASAGARQAVSSRGVLEER